jgi:hypothetical protein
MNEQNFEERLLKAMKSTLLAVIKDTTTKPELKHPLTKNTQIMITDCLDIISYQQHDKVKESEFYKPMKPMYSDENVSQSVNVNNIK